MRFWMAPSARLKSAPPTKTTKSNLALDITPSPNATKARVATGDSPKQGEFLVIVLAVLHPDHELQSRPDLVHRAHFYIDQSCLQPNLSHPVLVEVGCNTGGPLRPTYPQHPGRSSSFAKLRNCFFNSTAVFTKIIAKSIGPPLAMLQLASTLFNSACTSDGTLRKATRNCGLMPSFWGKGVPEYPAMR